MDTRKTLKELFESRRQELTERLNGMSLPNDAEKIQTTVTNYLNELFDSDGEFRQSLTQSEDYILHAAMSLLTAQQSMIGEFTHECGRIPEDNQEEPTQETMTSNLCGDKQEDNLLKNKFPFVLGGTTAGGAAGALLFGSWGAVFGAIAGTAIVLYYDSVSKAKQGEGEPNKTMLDKQALVSKPEVQQPKNSPIDTEKFLSIIDNICDSVDSLILTFRTQIRRVVDKYESMEKPTLEGDYLELLENIQALLGAATLDAESDARAKQVEKRIQLLGECLENYDIQVINYDGENSSLFNLLPSPSVEKEKMVAPAFVKNGNVIIKGKVFIKQQ